MRRPAIGTCLLALVLTAAAAAPGAQADPSDPSPPTRAEIREARDEARGAERDVASVQVALDAANADLMTAEIAALQAAEAYNGARYRAQQAHRAARAAERESARADRALAAQKDSYRESVLASYGDGVGLGALEGILDADGMSSVLDQTVTAGIVQEAYDAQRTDYLEAAEAAEAAAQTAADAEADAVAAAGDARRAKDAAQAAADRAAATALAIADEKERLIRRLARLQGITVELAEQRQAALDAAERQEQLEQQQDALEPPETEQPETEQPETDVPETDGDPETDGSGTGAPGGDGQGAGPGAPAAGADAAIEFARAQLGEPYVWAAAGPGAWDCSGLTMGAWAAGGISLPHYSVAQYEASTPISAGDLVPGDLVFWSSSGSASGIFHVALYVGDGMMIHAPRTGRPVTEESMHYWIPPTHFARP